MDSANTTTSGGWLADHLSPEWAATVSTAALTFPSPRSETSGANQSGGLAFIRKPGRFVLTGKVADKRGPSQSFHQIRSLPSAASADIFHACPSPISRSKPNCTMRSGMRRTMARKLRLMAAFPARTSRTGAGNRLGFGTADVSTDASGLRGGGTGTLAGHARAWQMRGRRNSD